MIRFAARFQAGAVLVGGALLAGCAPSAPPPPLTDADLAQRAGLARDPATPLQRIAFGSCNRTDLPQPLWEPIGEAAPDLWIWLGDNIYADTDDMDVMRTMYEDQLAQPGYVGLLETTAVIGTWDDHDYGMNNAGSENPARAESQAELLDFLGEPRDSERRGRAGVYTSYVYGEAPSRTKVILLDTRYHRDPPGADGDILGEEQWAWLEAQLTGSDAQPHLIGGGIQFLPEQHPNEKWADFPVGELYKLLSFGVIEVDWDAGTVSLQLRAEDGSVAVEAVSMLSLHGGGDLGPSAGPGP